MQDEDFAKKWSKKIGADVLFLTIQFDKTRDASYYVPNFTTGGKDYVVPQTVNRYSHIAYFWRLKKS